MACLKKCLSQALDTYSRPDVLRGSYRVSDLVQLLCLINHDAFFVVEHVDRNFNTSANPIVIPPGIECLVVYRTSARYIRQLPSETSIEGKPFELRFLSCSSGTTVFARHGDMFKGWWKSASHTPVFRRVQNNGGTEMEVAMAYWDVAVYVVRTTPELDELRDQYLMYMGGQTKARCQVHHSPLITASVPTKNEMCCTDREGGPCVKKAKYRCPRLGCRSLLCGDCFKSIPEGTSVSVTPREATTEATETNNHNTAGSNHENVGTTNVNGRVGANDNDVNADDPNLYNEHPDDIGSSTSSVDWDSDDESRSEGSEGSNHGVDTSNFPDPKDFHMGADNPIFDDELSISDDDPAPQNGIPMTVATADDPVDVEQSDRSTFLTNTALLSGIGSLLVRREYRSRISRTQSEFLQNIIASQSGSTVPLVYPEAMLFPSSFPFDNGYDGSILGATPSAFLSQKKNRANHNIAAIEDHNRIFLKSARYQDFRLQAFKFDCNCNANLAGKDTRLIVNRGLVESGTKTGMSLRNKDDTFFSDSIDNRSVVNSLTAAQKYHPSNFFLTLTCNTRLHFGLRHITEWLDRDEFLCYYPGINKLNEVDKDEIRDGLRDAAGTLIQRNWLKVRAVLMKYITESPEKPLGKIGAAFWRDEYQEDQGNLPHVHALFRVEFNEDDRCAVEEFQDRVRGCLVDIVRLDEIDDLVARGLLDSHEDWCEVLNLAEQILTHRTRRNMKRTGPGDNDIQPREGNNFYKHPNPTNHVMQTIDPGHTAEAVRILSDCGLCSEPPPDAPRLFRNPNPQLQCKRHHPPTCLADGNMSPVVGELFCAIRSMMNAQVCTGYSVNRYLTKYIVKMDKNSMVLFDVSTRQTETYQLKMKSEFLYNTKISSSAYHEAQRHKLKRNKNHPQGRGITRHEMTQVMLQEPQVHTNLVFAKIPTVPLEERSGLQKMRDADKETDDVPIQELRDYRVQCGNDTVQFIIETDKARRDMGLPVFRQFTQAQLVLLDDFYYSKVTVDNITLFGFRPPELLPLIRSPGIYYRWFSSTKGKRAACRDPAALEIALDSNINESLWIDGLGHRLRLRCGAMEEVREHVRLLQNTPGNQAHPELLALLARIVDSHQFYGFTIETDAGTNDADRKLWYRLQLNFIDFTEARLLLPVPVYSNISPTNPTRFLFHVLLSMGEYDTEMELLNHATLRGAFIHANLIDENDLEGSITGLVTAYILQQLSFYPITTHKFDRFVVASSRTLREVLIHNSIPLFEAPACLYTKVLMGIDDRIEKRLQSLRTEAVKAAYRELAPTNVGVEEAFPSLDWFLDHRNNNSWNGNLAKSPLQTEASYIEQLSVRTPYRSVQ